MIFTVGWNLAGIAGWCSGQIVEVAVYMTIQALIATPLQAFNLRKSCNVRFVALTCIVWGCSEFAGTLLLAAIESSPSPWFKRGLGVMLLVIFLWETSNLWVSAVASLRGRHSSAAHATSSASCVEKFDVRKKRNLLWTIVFGLGGGFLRGVSNIPILALVIFSLYSGMQKNEWRASQAAITFLVTLPKAYVLIFQLHAYSPELWPQYVVCALSALAAIPLGNKIASAVDQKSFREFILAILFFGALLMSTQGTGVISVFTIAILAACHFLGTIAWKCRRAYIPSIRNTKRDSERELTDPDPHASVVGASSPEPVANQVPVHPAGPDDASV
eukprot:TRINITY_DN10225_c0_g1_i2.p1 TRINITY_DN10225_c0_g1~~TRINITY_DN10225_c0_g1_i2.p1  ORF type:complete len:376 (+),score=21.89 TRINITY_DN10225_c0_g1_i2:138-1130(+)